MNDENLRYLSQFDGHLYATPLRAWSKNRANINLVDIINKLPFFGEAID